MDQKTQDFYNCKHEEAFYYAQENDDFEGRLYDLVYCPTCKSYWEERSYLDRHEYPKGDFQTLKLCSKDNIQNEEIDDRYIDNLNGRKAIVVNKTQISKPFDKFLIAKREDIDKYLDDSERSLLYDLMFKISHGRYHDDKSISNTYLVINTDEPYSDEIIKIMKANGQWG